MLAPHWRTWRLEDTETGVSGNRRASPAHRNRSIRNAVSGRAACRDVIAAFPSLRALLTPHQATADSARRLTQLPRAVSSRPALAPHAISSAVGPKTSLMTGTCLGWMADLPPNPSRRACIASDRRPSGPVVAHPHAIGRGLDAGARDAMTSWGPWPAPRFCRAAGGRRADAVRGVRWRYGADGTSWP